MIAPSDVTLRGPEDLPALGVYLRAQRYRAGLSLSSHAAPYLGVGVRLLVQLESGTRGKRGVTLGKLLDVLKGLGLELVVRPRPSVVGEIEPAPSTDATSTTSTKTTMQHKKNTKTTKMRSGRSRTSSSRTSSVTRPSRRPPGA